MNQKYHGDWRRMENIFQATAAVTIPMARFPTRSAHVGPIMRRSTFEYPGTLAISPEEAEPNAVSAIAAQPQCGGIRQTAAETSFRGS